MKASLKARWRYSQSCWPWMHVDRKSL